MPFDSLPGRLGNIPTLQYQTPPPIINPPKGPMIAEAIKGLAGIIGDNFSPKAREHQKLEDLQNKALEKKLHNYLSGVLDPTDALSYREKQLEIQNKIKQGKILDNKMKPQAPVFAPYLKYFNSGPKTPTKVAPPPVPLVRSTTPSTGIMGPDDPQNFSLLNEVTLE